MGNYLIQFEPAAKHFAINVMPTNYGDAASVRTLKIKFVEI